MGGAPSRAVGVPVAGGWCPGVGGLRGGKTGGALTVCVPSGVCVLSSTFSVSCSVLRVSVDSANRRIRVHPVT